MDISAGSSHVGSSGDPGFQGSNHPELTHHVEVPRRSKTSLFFGHYRQETAGLGIIEPTPLADTVMISIEFNARGTTDMFEDGSHVRRPPIRPGSLGIFDLRASWAAQVWDPFDNLNMFVPLQAFRQLADENGATFTGFNCRVEDDNCDETMLFLAQAMLPALARPAEVSNLFIDHLLNATLEHLGGHFTVFSKNFAGKNRGLTLLQRGMVLDYIEANYHLDLSLEDLAIVSGMSESGFARAFKQTMGMPPHRWLLQKRIEKAAQRLLNTDARIIEIAFDCGFADQSHLTRVFMRHMGLSPGVWRRCARA